MASRARGMQLGAVVGGVMLTLAIAASSGAEGKDEGAPAPYVAAATPEEAGRYVVIVGGCNDCHTVGWGETNGGVPEDRWLTGSPVGFRGPWGTSYPANLRLTVQQMGEDAFVARAKAGRGLPPMPWMNLARTTQSDLRAVYRFIRALGPAGERAPAPVPPGVEPATPYIVFEPLAPSDAAR